MSSSACPHFQQLSEPLIVHLLTDYPGRRIAILRAKESILHIAKFPTSPVGASLLANLRLTPFIGQGTASCFMRWLVKVIWQARYMSPLPVPGDMASACRSHSASR